MMMARPMNISVVGAGLMGHGIAQVFATAGHDVAIHDASAAVLSGVVERIRGNLRDLDQDQAGGDRVTPHQDIASAVRNADFVVEAALENLPLKQALFAQIEQAAPPTAILASNTSVIPITAIMEKLKRRQRAIGTHWWNPPFLVPLVEVIPTQWTDDSTLAQTMALHQGIGKTPVHVKKDVPGFIGNRLQHALWREAISLVERGICDAETVDIVVKASFGRRLAVLGPMENVDLVGADLTLAIHQTVLSDLESRPGPSPVLESMVAEGRLGMKSGEGFYRWTPERQSALRTRVLQYLKQARG
jgi:3-hydroxybutyryl-CoA dehydrogenase